MKEKKGKGTQKPDNVEFGVEFGDMNASKLYETPFSGKPAKADKRRH
ncbi:hypothetical protein [Bacillus sp. T33-2]|nr:hypothetical protein [Bacillus sp. T33-2]